MDDKDVTEDTESHTIDISGYSYNTNYASMNSIPWPTSNVTITSSTPLNTGATGAGSILTSNGYNGTSWSSVYIPSTSPGLSVKGDSTFDGDIKIKGRSLEKLLTTIEDRLAILQDPDPKKLEKYAALKKAYDHYKTLERLIGED
jgi:hypothetical protein